MTGRSWPLYPAAAIAMVCWASECAAYRPFDGTDADVVDPGEVELEIGPAGYRRQGTSRFIVAPAAVANYGFAPGFEAVLEARRELQFNATPHLWHVEDGAFSIKSVLRRGALQGGTGLSVALENGILIPGFESRFGVHVASIFSLRFPAITFHLNLVNNILSPLGYQPSAGLILEGPDTWRVRPVAEMLLEREFGQGSFHNGLAESALLGGIGRLSDALSLDAAGRFGNVDGRPEQEVRVGFTWGFEP